MSDKSSASSGGIGLFGILGVVFIVLKLLGITVVATWSWWLVTLPLWGGLAFVLALLLIVGLVTGLLAIFSK